MTTVCSCVRGKTTHISIRCGQEAATTQTRCANSTKTKTMESISVDHLLFNGRVSFVGIANAFHQVRPNPKSILLEHVIDGSAEFCS